MHLGVVRVKVNPATSDKILNLLLPFFAKYKMDDFIDHLVRKDGIKNIIGF